MSKKNILLLCGGGSTEHEISLVSSKYVEKTVRDLGLYDLTIVEIGAPKSKDKTFRIIRSDSGLDGQVVELNSKGHLVGSGLDKEIHFIIPCIHGPPGETGEIQTYFEQTGIPYLGCGPEASQICFNKVTSKLWFNALDIPNTPFVFLTSLEDKQKAHDLFAKEGKVFIKAASQGSSVGCYQVFKQEDLDARLADAFKYSQYVLVEKMVTARELEISTYELNGEIKTTVPGEISCPSKFYSYDEKYDPNSKTTTEIEAPGLTPLQIKTMREYAYKAFKGLKLSHLSRIDFFLTDEGQIYLNEINTFPGMTPISMFPKMMENGGDRFSDFLAKLIEKNIK